MTKVNGSTEYCGVTWEWVAEVGSDYADVVSCHVGNQQADIGEMHKDLIEKIEDEAMHHEDAPRTKDDFSEHNVWSKAQTGCW